MALRTILIPGDGVGLAVLAMSALLVCAPLRQNRAVLSESPICSSVSWPVSSYEAGNPCLCEVLRSASHVAVFGATWTPRPISTLCSGGGGASRHDLAHLIIISVLCFDSDLLLCSVLSDECVSISLRQPGGGNLCGRCLSSSSRTLGLRCFFFCDSFAAADQL